MAHETVRDFVNWEDVADCDEEALLELDEDDGDISNDELYNIEHEDYEIDGC
jgi:hypothetical protein